MEQRFRVTFSGEIAEGQDVATVKQRLAEIFKMPAESVDQLVSGKPVVKGGLTQDQATRYRAVLERAGAVCQVEREPAATRPDAPPSAATPAPPRGGQMSCPKCGLEQPTSTTCAGCGVVIAKAAAPRERQKPPPAVQPAAAPAVGVDRPKTRVFPLLILAIVLICAAMIVVQATEDRRQEREQEAAEVAKAERERFRRMQEQSQKYQRQEELQRKMATWRSWRTWQRIEARSAAQPHASVVGVFQQGQTVYSSRSVDRYTIQRNNYMVQVWDKNETVKGWVPISALR